jgi:hypothetical protein
MSAPPPPPTLVPTPGGDRIPVRMVPEGDARMCHASSRGRHKPCRFMHPARVGPRHVACSGSRQDVRSGSAFVPKGRVRCS